MGGTLPERLGRLPPIVYRGGVIRQISAGHRLLRDPVGANLVNTGRRARVPLDRRNRNTATALISRGFWAVACATRSATAAATHPVVQLSSGSWGRSGAGFGNDGFD